MQRYLDGVSSVAATDPLAGFPYLDPTKWIVYHDNFLVLPTSLGWTHTQTNGTLAVTATGMTQTLAGADNDLSQLYMTTATFALVSGKEAFFEVKTKVDKGAGGTIGQQEMFAGLCTVQTGNNFIAADGLSLAVDNAVGIVSYDGSTDLNAVVRKADAESVNLAAGTYADATAYVLTWHFTGVYIDFYIDGSMVARIHNFPTAAIGPCLYIKAGEAFASVLTSSYVFVAVER